MAVPKLVGNPIDIARILHQVAIVDAHSEVI